MSIQAFTLSSMTVLTINQALVRILGKNAIEESSAVFLFDVSYFAAGPKAHNVYNQLMFTYNIQEIFLPLTVLEF